MTNEDRKRSDDEELAEQARERAEGLPVSTGRIDIEDREIPSSGASALRSALSKTMGPRLDPVSYQLSVQGAPDPGWHVRRVHFVEAISEPYELNVELITDDTDYETDELLGADAQLEILRNTYARSIAGVVEQVDFLGVASERLMVRLRIVPAFKLLTHQVDTRIFQDQTVPEILQEVLEPSLGQYGRTLDRSRLTEKYLVRDYCVQYGESYFAFASRLMQEEGIAYIFESKDGEDGKANPEQIVLVDQGGEEPNADLPRIKGDTLEQIPIITDRPETADYESLRYLEWCRPEQVTKLTTRRFNWKRPDPEAPPTAEHQRPDARDRTREVYVPDTRRRIEDYQKRDSYRGTKASDDEEPLTVKRFQMFTGSQARGQGASNVTCMRAGGVFEVADHPHGSVAFKGLLATRAVHFGDCPEEEMGAAGAEVLYQNTFECIPVGTPFRPPEVTPKPRVFGPQTATVVGPKGEEIHTDVHGRIKVRFHWDRVSALDDSASCWVRVAQMWAGPGWGTWFLPRIGMEVVVDFLEGNPDRPLVVGCVYNGRNGTPYPLPEEKTKSTIKTNSSVGGEGFNEIRFEDAKDKEEIYIRAQRDQREDVFRNRRRLVEGNEWVTIRGNTSVRIGGHPSHGESEGIAQGRETWIDGHEKLNATETVHICASKRLVLEVPGSSIVLEPGLIEISAGDGSSIRLDKEIFARSSDYSTFEIATDISASTESMYSVYAGEISAQSIDDVVVQGKGVFLNSRGAGVAVKGSSTVFVGNQHESFAKHRSEEKDEYTAVSPDVVVIGWIDPDLVPLDVEGVDASVLDHYPPNGKVKGVLYKLRVGAHLLDIMLGSLRRPGKFDVHNLQVMSKEDRNYILCWLFKFAANSKPPESFGSESELRAFVEEKTKYKLYNRLCVKYAKNKGAGGMIVGVVKSRVEIGTTIDPVFGDPDEGAAGDHNGELGHKPEFSYQINDGTPTWEAVRVFNVLAGDDLKWNHIGSLIKMHYDGTYEVVTQVFPTYFIYEAGETGGYNVTEKRVQADSPRANFSKNPYPPGKAPFILD